MINYQMKKYNYSLYGEVNEYGELTFPSTVAGQVEMAINIYSQTIGDNILYSEAEYIGLTKANITDKYIIHYGNEKLKVKYINDIGKLKQVYLTRM